MPYKDPEKRRQYNREYLKEHNPEYHRKRWAEDPEYRARKRAQALEARERNKDNPEWIAQRKEIELKSWFRRIERVYGISRTEYEALYQKQNGLCAICNREPRTGRAKRLHVDHCHSGKHVRGLLCFDCNTALGKLRDSPELAERAAKYLRNEPLS